MASVSRTFSRFGRMYRIPLSKGAPEGKFSLFPSVTSVLQVLDKSFLVPWAVRLSMDVVREALVARESAATAAAGDAPATPSGPGWIEELVVRASTAAETQRKLAADFGTRAHAAIDTIIKGGVPVITDDIAPVVAGFSRWYASSGITLSPAGDFPVYSRKYKFAGAADCLGRTSDGSLVVLDFKTSNSIHGQYALQLAAYAHAVEEMWEAGELDVDAMLGGKGVGASDSSPLLDSRASHIDSRAGGDGLSAEQHSLPVASPAPSSRDLGSSGSALSAASSATATAVMDIGLSLQFDGFFAAPAGASQASTASSISSASISLPRARTPIGSATASGDIAAPASSSSSKIRKSKAKSPKTPNPFVNPIVDDDFILSISGSSAQPLGRSATNTSSSSTITSGSLLMSRGPTRAFSTGTLAVDDVGVLSTPDSSISAHDLGVVSTPCSSTSTLADGPVDTLLASDSLIDTPLDSLIAFTASTSSAAASTAGVVSSLNQSRTSLATTSSGTVSPHGQAASPLTASSTSAGRGQNSSSSSLAGQGQNTSSSSLTGRGRNRPRVIAIVVRLDKTTGAADVKQVADLSSAFDAFKAALLLWHTNTQQAWLLQPVAPVAPY